MAGKQIIPAVVKYTKMLADTANAVKAFITYALEQLGTNDSLGRSQ